MAARPSNAFKRDAVRIAMTSGPTKGQVASDPGVGLATLNTWVKAVSDEASPPDPGQNLLRQNERLRRKNRILKAKRELPKKATQVLAGHPKAASTTPIAAANPVRMPTRKSCANTH